MRGRGVHESDDAEVSRSSRGKKGFVGGDAVEGQKFETSLGCG